MDGLPIGIGVLSFIVALFYFLFRDGSRRIQADWEECQARKRAYWNRLNDFGCGNYVLPPGNRYQGESEGNHEQVERIDISAAGLD